MPTSPDAVVIYMTAPNLTVAKDLARHLVAEHLIACANVLPGMTSIYRWNGQVETSDEVAMILKTGADRVADVVAAVEARHPYDTPAVVVLDVVGGSAAFLAWVAEESRPV
ncbi:MAG: divalent-cation tolerance protein CutA [Pseudomonadota bacterium]